MRHVRRKTLEKNSLFARALTTLKRTFKLPLSGRLHLLAVPTSEVFLLSSPLFRGHQALDTLSFPLFQEYGEEKYSLEIERDTGDCGPVMLQLPSRI